LTKKVVVVSLCAFSCAASSKTSREILQKLLFDKEDSKTPLGLYKSLPSVKGNSDGDLAIRTRLSKYTVMDLMMNVTAMRSNSACCKSVMVGSTLALTAQQNLAGAGHYSGFCSVDFYLRHWPLWVTVSRRTIYKRKCCLSYG
jgi:hypothetical protein